MGLSRPMAEELRAKYAEMLAMRIEHASGLEVKADVALRMATLAARFPGALRELDALELGEIRRRIARLDAIVDATGEEEAWMEPVALFHRLARGALAAKRWLAGRRRVDGSLSLAFARDTSAMPLGEEVREWAADLERIAAPPRGRVLDLVYARLAAQLGVTVPAARTLVFGDGR